VKWIIIKLLHFRGCVYMHNRLMSGKSFAWKRNSGGITRVGFPRPYLCCKNKITRWYLQDMSNYLLFPHLFAKCSVCSGLTLDLLSINSCDVIGPICKSMLMQLFHAFVLAKLAAEKKRDLLNRPTEVIRKGEMALSAKKVKRKRDWSRDGTRQKTILCKCI